MSDEGLDPFNNPSRVTDTKNDTIGVVWFEDYASLDDQTAIDEVMRHLEPKSLLSSATSILDAVDLFASADNNHFFVIEKNKIIGVLFYKDLFKPIGRLAFLSLALEIEDLALRLCQSETLRGACWLSISSGRKRKSVELFQQRFNRKPRLETQVRNQIVDEEIKALIEVSSEGLSLREMLQNPKKRSDISLLIACTELKDKATMLWKQRLVEPKTGSQVLGFFEELRKIRDRCAHPGSDEELLPKDRLAHFVISARGMRKDLHELIQGRRAIT